MAVETLCSVDGCDKPRRGPQIEFCGAHYSRNRRYGDPLGGGKAKGTIHKWIADHLGHQGDECLIWPFATLNSGYAAMHVGRSMTTTSRVICEKVNGPAPEKWHEAAHSCGKGHLGCVHPGHLSWKQPSENRADKVSHGTHNRGSQNHRSRLNETQVLEIRSLRGTEKVSTIADRYGVSSALVSQVLSRAVWAWLPDPSNVSGDQ